MRLLSAIDIFDANWDSWQDIAIIVLFALIIAIVLFLIIFALTQNSRAESSNKRMAKRITWYEKQIAVKREILSREKEQIMSELEEKRAELKGQEKRAESIEAEAAEARKKIEENEQKIRTLMQQCDMSKKELALYQKREGTNVSEDIAINAITDKSLAASKFEMDKKVLDCRLPLDKTQGANGKTAAEYVLKKANVKMGEISGKRPVVYKVEDKTIMLLQELDDGKFRLSFKCGPAYGAKLIKYKPDNVQNAKFPYGLLWFSIDNINADVSCELLETIIEISYHIGRLGY